VLRTTLTVNDETIDDALEAVALLRGRRDIDSTRIYILGHSLGGMLVPRIGMRDKSIAGATRPLEDVIIEQLTYLFGLDGTIDEQEQKKLDDAKQQRSRIKALTPNDTTSGPMFATPPSYWLDLKGYDPPALAVRLSAPILILQGGRDYQVTKSDFERWRSALKSRPNVTFGLYPMLNHLFIEGEGQSTPAEYERAGHVSEQVLTDILRWIKL